jgi:hypothetical protein
MTIPLSVSDSTLSKFEKTQLLLSCTTTFKNKTDVNGLKNQCPVGKCEIDDIVSISGLSEPHHILNDIMEEEDGEDEEDIIGEKTESSGATSLLAT